MNNLYVFYVCRCSCFSQSNKKNPAFDQFNLNNSFTLWTVLVCGYSFGGGNVI